MAKKTKAAARPKRYCADRFGVLNHVGDIWSPETFETSDQAHKYLANQQAANPTWSLNRHQVIPVRVIVSAIKPTA